MTYALLRERIVQRVEAAHLRFSIYAASGHYEMDGSEEPNVEDALLQFDDELEAEPDINRHSASDREFFELMGVA